MTLVCILPCIDSLKLYIEKGCNADRCTQFTLNQMKDNLIWALNGVDDEKLNEQLNFDGFIGYMKKANVIDEMVEDIEYLNSCYDAARQARFEYGEKG
jgi:hypothetical protein